MLYSHLYLGWETLVNNLINYCKLIKNNQKNIFKCNILVNFP